MTNKRKSVAITTNKYNKVRKQKEEEEKPVCIMFNAPDHRSGLCMGAISLEEKDFDGMINGRDRRGVIMETILNNPLVSTGELYGWFPHLDWYGPWNIFDVDKHIITENLDMIQRSRVVYVQFYMD